jgi:hypothetical protein
LRIEQPAKVNGVGPYQPLLQLDRERQACVVPLNKGGTTWVELSDAIK